MVHENRGSTRRRGGISLVEVLVVIAIIGILVALTIVAVQRVRASARQTQCLDHLRQIGLAMSSYHSLYGALPPAVIWEPPGEPLGQGLLPIGVIDRVARTGDPAQDTIYANWVIMILPYLDQSNLGAEFDMRYPISHPSNATARQATVPVLVCPSDPYSGAANLYHRGLAVGLTDNLYARGNYAINVGPDNNCVDAQEEIPPCHDGFFVRGTDLLTDVDQVWGTGVAGVNKSFAFSSIVDGLSQTVVLDEIRAGLDELDPRGAWALGLVGASAIARHGLFGSAVGPNPCEGWDQFIGCGALKAREGIRLARECMRCNEGPAGGSNVGCASRSLHAGGVNVLLADGASRFISDSIEAEVWHAIHTRNRKETIDPPFQ